MVTTEAQVVAVVLAEDAVFLAFFGLSPCLQDTSCAGLILVLMHHDNTCLLMWGKNQHWAKCQTGAFELKGARGTLGDGLSTDFGLG